MSGRENNYIFFDNKSILSNYKDCNIKIKLSNYPIENIEGLEDEVNFSSAEQAYQYLKAVTFRDKEAAIKILKSVDKIEMNNLGKKVLHFNKNLWDKINEYIMEIVIFNKLSQNKYILDFTQSKIKENIDVIFINAIPFDNIWGIGYKAEDAMEFRKTWGNNLLGKIITKVSKDLLGRI